LKLFEPLINKHRIPLRGAIQIYKNSKNTSLFLGGFKLLNKIYKEKGINIIEEKSNEIWPLIQDFPELLVLSEFINTEEKRKYIVKYPLLLTKCHECKSYFSQEELKEILINNVEKFTQIEISNYPDIQKYINEIAVLLLLNSKTNPLIEYFEYLDDTIKVNIMKYFEEVSKGYVAEGQIKIIDEERGLYALLGKTPLKSEGIMICNIKNNPIIEETKNEDTPIMVKKVKIDKMYFIYCISFYNDYKKKDKILSNIIKYCI
jgi:hypothetical protein